MLKRTIKYEDFDGNPQEDTVYFNISKSELIELEMDYGDGFKSFLEKIIEAEDSKALVAEFKRIVLMAYGVRSEDGKRFIKSDELIKEFEQTAAYDSLFIELATDDGAAATFVNGILPRDVSRASESLSISQTPPLPPTNKD